MTGGSYRTECWVCEASIPMSARYCPRCGEVQTHEDEPAPEIRADGGQVVDADDQTVYVVTYYNEHPDDGFELGGVYQSEEAAEEAANERRCARYGWEQYSVNERAVQPTGGQDGGYRP